MAASADETSVSVAIEQVLSELQSISSLKEEQNTALEAFLRGKDVFVLLQTGFGKSLIYQSAPLHRRSVSDFAVLLKAGMSVKQAIIYNVLSALMAYVGMLIGTAVGTYTHNVTSWIFAITAGMFLYVALVDMLPEMLHGDSEEHKRCQVGHFILQNVGMLTGFSIMLLIAIFEDRIVFDFGF